jgi:hypothetical protein
MCLPPHCSTQAWLGLPVRINSRSCFHKAPRFAIRYHIESMSARRSKPSGSSASTCVQAQRLGRATRRASYCVRLSRPRPAASLRASWAQHRSAAPLTGPRVGSRVGQGVGEGAKCGPGGSEEARRMHLDCRSALQAHHTPSNRVRPAPRAGFTVAASGPGGRHKLVQRN